MVGCEVGTGGEDGAAVKSEESVRRVVGRAWLVDAPKSGWESGVEEIS